MNRKKTSRDYWQQHYQSFKVGDTSQREYCRQNNLGYWTFNKWKRVFEKENTSTSLQQVPVKYHSVKSERLEIILQDNLKISIPDDFSENTLKKVMSALRNES